MIYAPHYIDGNRWLWISSDGTIHRGTLEDYRKCILDELEAVIADCLEVEERRKGKW